MAPHASWQPSARARSAACAGSFHINKTLAKTTAIPWVRNHESQSIAMDALFPIDVQEFDGDDRISFSKLDSKFIAVRDDGAEFEFDAERRVWQPVDEQPLDETAPTLDLPQDLQGSGTAKRRHDDAEENGSEVSRSEGWSRLQPYYALVHCRAKILTIELSHRNRRS